MNIVSSGPTYIIPFETWVNVPQSYWMSALIGLETHLFVPLAHTISSYILKHPEKLVLN